MSNGARARLKAGFEEFNRSKKGLDTVKRAKEAAEIAIQTAEAELASFHDLDAQITKFRVAASKKGLNPKNLSDELKARVSARRDAVGELEQAKMTLEAIEEEYVAAESHQHELQDGRIRLVLEVFQEIAAGLLAELSLLNAKREELIGQISGLAETPVFIDGSMKFVGHTAYGVRLATPGNSDPVTQWPGGVTAMQANARRWETLISTLMNDPEADIQPPKPVRPSDLILGSMPPGGLVFARPFTLRPEA